MKTFIVRTESTCITEYKVKANTKEEAEQAYTDNDYLEEEDTDFFDETITDIEEVIE